MSFLSFWKQQSSTENSLGVPVPRSGFPGPKHGGEGGSLDVVRKFRSNKNAALATTINKTGLNIQQKISWGKHQAYQFLCQANSLCFLLLSSCLLEKPSFATSACRKGLTPRLVSVDTSPSCLERLGHHRDWNSCQDSTDIPLGM